MSRAEPAATSGEVSGTRCTTALIVGAGPAGLASARALQARQIDVAVLEKGSSPGHSWSQMYDSLRLHTGRHLSTLPDRRFARGTPLFPSRVQFLEYLREYARRFRLPIAFEREVLAARRVDGRWQATTRDEVWEARYLVIATGIVSNPFVPTFEGREVYRGRVVHSREYRRPDAFAGGRVLVVGVGNSGAEIAAELGAAGVDTTIAVRGGAHVMPRSVLGIPIQYLALMISSLPAPLRAGLVALMGGINRLLHGRPVLPRPQHSPLDRPPVIGFHLPEAIREGRVTLRPGVTRFTAHGVAFSDGTSADFDAVLLATGYRAELGFLEGLVTRDAKGFITREGVRCLDQPDLYVVGHEYAVVGGLANISRDARRLAHELFLRERGTSRTGT